MGRPRKSANAGGGTTSGGAGNPGSASNPDTRTGAGTSNPGGAPAAPATGPAVSVVEPEYSAEKARAREYRQAAKARAAAAAEAEATAAANQAALLVTIIDGLVMSSVGPDAAMREHERQMILDPLGRIIARMAPETRAAVDRYADPMALAFGVIAYGARVYSVAEARAKAARAAVAATVEGVTTWRAADLETSDQAAPVDQAPDDGAPVAANAWPKARTGLVEMTL